MFSGFHFNFLSAYLPWWRRTVFLNEATVAGDLGSITLWIPEQHNKI
jgi:hypothetical protein